MYMHRRSRTTQGQQQGHLPKQVAEVCSSGLRGRVARSRSPPRRHDGSWRGLINELLAFYNTCLLYTSDAAD